MPIALEQPKKPVGGAYGIFLAQKRPEFAKACAGQKASMVAKMAGEQWKKMTDKEKAAYQKQYEEVKAKFDKDMGAFLAAGGEKTKGVMALRRDKRKERDGKKKDKNAPKKPCGGAYGVFLAENREKIKKTLPAGHKMTDVTKAASTQWNALPDAKKKPFQEKFLQKQEEYKAALAEYKKNLPVGEDADEDEEDGDEGEEGEDEEEEDEEEEEPSPKKIRRAGA